LTHSWLSSTTLTDVIWLPFPPVFFLKIYYHWEICTSEWATYFCYKGQSIV